MKPINRLYEKIGELIRARREDANMTQDELAQRVELTRTSITNIENGRQRIQVDTLYAIAEALRVPSSALFPPDETGETTLVDSRLLKGLRPDVRDWVKSMLVLRAEGPDSRSEDAYIAEQDANPEDIVHEVGIKEPPIPVERIARMQGVEVRYGPFKGSLAGLVHRGEEDSIICVNSLQPQVRQRFTIAHMLGHLIRQGTDEIFWSVFHLDVDFRFTKDREEIKANHFASELLMPGFMLDRDLKGKALDYEDDELIRELADRYKVSSQLMVLRLVSQISTALPDEKS